MISNPIARYHRLPGARRRLLLRAALTLTFASAAVALQPFRKAIRLGSIALRRQRPNSPEDIIWAVEATARRMPWRTVCLQKGLAAQRMLRANGIDARLHYGVRHASADRDLEAHVWVTVGERPVIGGEEAVGFAALASFP
jgi:hypothetical protein